MPCTRSILILGGDADGNLGDRAILLSTCLGLAARASGVELWTLSSRLRDLAAPIDVRTVPRGPGRLLRLCMRAARSDLVLCGGGGLFQDDDSLVKMPYWALRLALMRIFCRRIVGYSLGVGPLRAATSKAFARLAFACMRRITVRDPAARASAAPLTAKKLDILPDPAFLTPAAPKAATRAWLENQRIPLDGRLLIGVSTRRWFPARYRPVPNRITATLRRNIVDESPEAKRYIALLAEALCDLGRLDGRHLAGLAGGDVEGHLAGGLVGGVGRPLGEADEKQGRCGQDSEGCRDAAASGYGRTHAWRISLGKVVEIEVQREIHCGLGLPY